MKNWFTKFNSLKFKIITRVSLIVSLLVTITVAYQNYATKELVIKNALFFLERQNQSLVSRVIDFFDESNKELAAFEQVLSSNNNIAVDHALHLMELSPKLLNLTIVLSDKERLIISRFNENSFAQKRFFSQEIKQSTRYVAGIVNHTGSIVKFVEYNRQLEPIASLSISAACFEKYIQDTQSSSYDCIKTNVPSESQITNTKVITLKRQFNVKDKSFILIGDISVERFSLFLDANRVSENTRLFIIDNNQDVIADSSILNANKLLTLQSPTMEVLKLSLDSYQKSNNSLKKNTFFSEKNTDYVSVLARFPSVSNLDWTVVSVTPELDFTGEANQIRTQSLLIASILLIIVLFSLYFQIHKFSQPISNLEIEAKKIHNFDLEDSVSIESNAREIMNLSKEMQGMKVSVKNFSRFIPRSLVERLVSSGEEVEVGGKEVPLTIFFSDIANFTTISESTEPNALIVQLSEYLEELTSVILKNNGTVDKYIGDAIMAFWGAPEQDQKRSEHACLSALICQQKLIGLNKYWANNDQSAFFTRIGIHSGTAVVGNIGSSERMNYTAIGDSVNLAARLEGTNKLYGTSILISENVVGEISKDFVTRPVDVVAVKGKAKGTRIFELVGIHNHDYLRPVSDDYLKHLNAFKDAYNIYSQHDWAESLKAFKALVKMAKAQGIQDHVAEIYVKRCEEFLKTPPPHDWDGVYIMKTK